MSSSINFIAPYLLRVFMCQVFVMKITRRIYGVTRRFFRMAPVHHHFELCGFREPIIVASAYAISFAFALIAGYIGLISAWITREFLNLSVPVAVHAGTSPSSHHSHFLKPYIMCTYFEKKKLSPRSSNLVGHSHWKRTTNEETKIRIFFHIW